MKNELRKKSENYERKICQKVSHFFQNRNIVEREMGKVSKTNKKNGARTRVSFE